LLTPASSSLRQPSNAPSKQDWPYAELIAHSYISPIPRLIFTGGESKVRNLASIFDTSTTCSRQVAIGISFLHSCFLDGRLVYK